MMVNLLVEVTSIKELLFDKTSTLFVVVFTYNESAIDEHKENNKITRVIRETNCQWYTWYLLSEQISLV
mgnify:CR=1 FL=1